MKIQDNCCFKKRSKKRSHEKDAVQKLNKYLRHMTISLGPKKRFIYSHMILLFVILAVNSKQFLHRGKKKIKATEMWFYV